MKHSSELCENDVMLRSRFLLENFDLILLVNLTSELNSFILLKDCSRENQNRTSLPASLD